MQHMQVQYLLHDGKKCATFEKYSALHELEVRHGVDLGFAHKTAPTAKLFIHYIAESQCQQLQALAPCQVHILGLCGLCALPIVLNWPGKMLSAASLS